MTRSGYDDDDGYDNSVYLYRKSVNRALKGKRGQKFLQEMLEAIHNLPEKRLIAGDLENKGEVCAIGAVGKKRKIDMQDIYPEDAETIANKFNIAVSMVREIEYINDEVASKETPEQRYIRMSQWIKAQLKIEN